MKCKAITNTTSLTYVSSKHMQMCRVNIQIYAYMCNYDIKPVVVRTYAKLSITNTVGGKIKNIFE